MEQKVIIVNGAAGDIGKSIVSTLLIQGYLVAACVRNIAIAGLKQDESLTLFECDITDENSVKQCVAEIKQQFKQIYGLINCVGVAHGSPFLMTKIEDMQRVFDVNYFSLIRFSQLIAKRMLKQKSGCIINLASTAGELADKGTLAYGGSKAALIHTTQVMAAELGVFGIRVNAIAPAVVESKMATMMTEESIELLDNRALINTAIQPQQVADMAAFLLSNSAVSITGQVLKIDRGITV